jgi:hypothetical protein
VLFERRKNGFDDNRKALHSLHHIITRGLYCDVASVALKILLGMWEFVEPYCAGAAYRDRRDDLPHSTRGTLALEKVVTEE